MDGVVGVTQKAVPAGGNFVYQFKISDTQAGTFWYIFCPCISPERHPEKIGAGTILTRSFSEVMDSTVVLSYTNLS